MIFAYLARNSQSFRADQKFGFTLGSVCGYTADELNFEYIDEQYLQT